MSYRLFESYNQGDTRFARIIPNGGFSLFGCGKPATLRDRKSEVRNSKQIVNPNLKCEKTLYIFGSSPEFVDKLKRDLVNCGLDFLRHDSGVRGIWKRAALAWDPVRAAVRHRRALEPENAEGFLFLQFNLVELRWFKD